MVAVAMGAVLIEKHFTLDNKKIGWDNQMATEPEQFREMIEKCRMAYDSLGSYERVLSADEIEQSKKMRRSVVSAKALSAGQILTAQDLTVKRPGTGIPADKLPDLVGRRLNRDIEADNMISETDLEN